MLTEHQDKHLGIRHDIDGLRALAVLLVVFYHIGLSDFGGGFIGVDVFFVISGYLIIPAVFRQTRNGTFSTSDFMMRRLRRLVPALLPVLAFCTVIALLFLSDSAFVDFVASALSASGFFANFTFLGQSGYFARDSDLLLLLHTWSLGVEFQFYLLLAVLALIVRSRMLVVLVVLALLSLLWAHYLVQNDQNRAFFGILPRFWELAFGGTLGLLQHRFVRLARFGWAMRIAGIGLILSAAFHYQSEMLFPGLMALVPVFGAGLIVAAPAQKRDPTFWFFNNRVMRWIGTRSYSIYLWHWPLLVSLKLAVVRPSEGELAAVALLAFPLAELSYRFIETPIRRGIWWQRLRPTFAIFLVPFLTLTSLWMFERQTSLITASRAHLPMHDVRIIGALAETPRSEYLSHMAEMGIDGRNGLCSLDQYKTVSDALDCLAVAANHAQAGSKQPVLIIGDSHGRDMLRALGYAFSDLNLVMLHESGCAPAAYSTTSNQNCFPDLNDKLAEVLRIVNPRLIVLASHWPVQGIAPTARTLDLLKSWDINVLIIGPAPQFQNPVVNVIHASGLQYKDLTPETRLPAHFTFDVYGASDAVNRMAQDAGVYVYDRLSVLCGPEDCRAFVPGDDLDLLYFDNQHLTQAGMRFLAKDMKKDARLRGLVEGTAPK